MRHGAFYPTRPKVGCLSRGREVACGQDDLKEPGKSCLKAAGGKIDFLRFCPQPLESDGQSLADNRHIFDTY